MKRHLTAVIVFAILLAIIPMFAINPAVPAPVQSNETPVSAPPITQDESSVPAQEPVAPVPDTAGDAAKEQPAATQVITEKGQFRLLDESTGKHLTLTTKEYVRGALAAEMPPTFHAEAMKAQAVAAHTYALCVQRLQEQTPDPSYRGADFTCNTKEWRSFVTEEQFRARYGSLADAYWNAICTAADAVSDYVLLYEGEPIVAAYHSMSTGMTEDGANVWQGDAPYLRAVESRGDALAPDFEVKTALTADEVRKALEKAFPGVLLGDTPERWITPGERSAGGYLLEVNVGDRTLHGKELRAALGLRSSALEIAYSQNSFTFTTKGYGHGVGLSQYGADFYARQGMAFWEILSHYYTGATLGAAAPQ